MPHGWFVFQLHDCLNCPVVVVDVDGPHHFLSLQISNPQQDLRNAVTATELHHLGAGGELGVHLEAAQFQVGETHLGVVTN